jgi:quinol monooxygenase YgiN
LVEVHRRDVTVATGKRGKQGGRALGMFRAPIRSTVFERLSTVIPVSENPENLVSTRRTALQLTRRTFLIGALAAGAGTPFPSRSCQNHTPMTPTIDSATGLTTLINVFRVAPADCDQLVSWLKEGTVDWISKIPGFLSSSLHVSRDRERVIIYGQWRDAEGISAMRQDPAMSGYFERIKAIATMEAITCDVLSTVAA